MSTEYNISESFLQQIRENLNAFILLAWESDTGLSMIISAAEMIDLFVQRYADSTNSALQTAGIKRQCNHVQSGVEQIQILSSNANSFEARTSMASILSSCELVPILVMQFNDSKPADFPVEKFTQHTAKMRGFVEHFSQYTATLRPICIQLRVELSQNDASSPGSA